MRIVSKLSGLNLIKTLQCLRISHLRRSRRPRRSPAPTAAGARRARGRASAWDAASTPRTACWRSRSRRSRTRWAPLCSRRMRKEKSTVRRHSSQTAAADIWSARPKRLAFPARSSAPTCCSPLGQARWHDVMTSTHDLPQKFPPPRTGSTVEAIRPVRSRADAPPPPGLCLLLPRRLVRSPIAAASGTVKRLVSALNCRLDPLSPPGRQNGNYWVEGPTLHQRFPPGPPGSFRRRQVGVKWS